MSEEFKAITTQEEFDKIVKNRINREREKYADYDQLKSENNDLKTQLDSFKDAKQTYENQVNDLQNELKTFKTQKLKSDIASEFGIPRSMAERLQGEDEETLRNDAKAMAEYFTVSPSVPPLKSVEPADSDPEKDAYHKLANSLFEGED